MGFAARSTASSLWRSMLSRLHVQDKPYPSTSSSSSSYGALLQGYRFMSNAPSPKLFVGGLSWSTDDNALREAFSDFGEICDAKVIMDRESGRSKGFGFVTFMSVEDAESAQKGMNNSNVNGRSIRVDFATEKPRGFGGFGGGGGGGMGFGGGGGFGDQSADSSSGDSFSRPSNSFSSFGKGSFGNDSFGGNNAFGSKDSFESDSFGKNSFGSASSTKDNFGSDSFDDNSSGNNTFDDDTFGDKDKY